MKRYNKRQVMKDAHRLYNNDFQRRGRSWSECLRAAWSWELDAVNNFLALMSAYSNHILITVLVLALVIYGLITIILKSKEVNAFIKEEKTNENWYKGIDSETLSYAMGYGRGNNFYCGD